MERKILTKTRRDFIKTAGAFAAGGLVVPFGCTPKKTGENAAVEVVDEGPKNVGIQIYTVRDHIDTMGIEAVLEKVAQTGYKWIEPFGYEDRKFLGKTPQEFKAILQMK